MSALKAKRNIADLDRVVLVLVLIIVGIGLVMVSSASQPLNEKDPFFYLKSQAQWVAIGLFLMLIISQLNLNALNVTWLIVPMMIVSLVLLVMVFVPGIRAPANGSFRWIKIAGQSFQPSEMVKGAMVLFFAHYMSKVGPGLRDFVRGMLPMTAIASLFIVIIAAETDLGGATMISLLMLVMLFLGGAKKRWIGLYLALGATGFMTMVTLVDYQRRRMFAFLHPWADLKGANYQISNSLVALGRGGIGGVGIGNGFQKLFYLPEIHTDFILANLGEETGLIGLLIVFFLFALLVFRSMRLAMRNREPFVRFVGLGAAALLGLQVIVNGGVVMCLLPTKGLAMPFLSYGGTSALLNFGLIGLILAAGRAAEPAARGDETMNLLPGRPAPATGLEE